MEKISALLAMCAGNSPVPGEFPAQRPVTRSFDVFFDLRLINRLSKQSRGWWFETLSRPLWRHCNASRYAETDRRHHGVAGDLAPNRHQVPVQLKTFLSNFKFYQNTLHLFIASLSSIRSHPMHIPEHHGCLGMCKITLCLDQFSLKYSECNFHRIPKSIELSLLGRTDTRPSNRQTDLIWTKITDEMLYHL